MNLTEDQRYFLSILRETGFIRLDQVLPLLRINEPQKEIIHAGALLRRLRYMGLLARSGDGCICLPDLLRDRPDSEILLSLDVLLALRPERLLQVSARQPYKLCFLLQRSDGWIDYFAVMPVQPGHEGRISQLLQAEQKKGASELLIPAHSLAALAAISRDSDVYEMGLAGKSIVFWNGELLFSARLMEGKYPNTKILFDSFQAKYSVNLSAEELASAVLSASVVAPENSRIEVAFGEHVIRVSAGEDRERATVPVKALVLSAPGQPFYYNYKTLLQYLRLVKGKVTLDFDERGLLAIRAGATQYIQSPLRVPKQAAQSQKAA